MEVRIRLEIVTEASEFKMIETRLFEGDVENKNHIGEIDAKLIDLADNYGLNYTQLNENVDFNERKWTDDENGK